MAMRDPKLPLAPADHAKSSIESTMPRYLSPRELAGALGMSESSLKRWIDAGRIRATRTEGGHRRIALADALAFVRETGTPVVHPELLAMGEAPVDPQPRRSSSFDDVQLARALFEGDAHAVQSWIQT